MFAVGQKVKYRWTQPGGYGYDVLLNATVLKVMEKRITIMATTFKKPISVKPGKLVPI